MSESALELNLQALLNQVMPTSRPLILQLRNLSTK